MRGRLMFAAGVATGYVLGARAGRSAYNSLKDRVQTAGRSPQVQNALGKAREFAEEKAPKLTNAVTSVAGGGSGSTGAASGSTTPTTATTSGDTPSVSPTPTPETPTPSAKSKPSGIPTPAEVAPLIAPVSPDLDESTSPTATA